MSDPVSQQIRQRHRKARDRYVSSGRFNAWVNGQAHETTSGEHFETFDPTIDEAITSLPACGAADVEAAVNAAWDAYDQEWSELSPAERSHRLSDWIDEIRAHEDELTILESLETGKPVEQARGEVTGAIDTLEFYAAIPRTLEGKQVPASDDVHVYTRNEPYGVVGQITPWNFPIWAAAWKLGPALATGNVSVLKPSAHGSLTTVRIAELSKGILPDGTINVVTGSGSDVGGPLTGHPDIRKLSFTGSVGVGTNIMKTAADHVTPVTLELGGKSPFIVFPDADLDAVVEAVADGIYYSTGEICDAFSRALVHEDVAAEFTERFVEAAESYVLGDPLDEDTTMGPLTTRDQSETVLEYISVGEEEGATVATGGDQPDNDALADGWYVEPTVFTDVENDMRIAQEEIFGPVQTIQTFQSYDEAIETANDTKFGLAAGIGTRDTSLAHTAAADLEAGLVYVNDYGPILPEAPYGGFKASGVGRDLGKEALDHYQQTKTIYVNLDDPSL